MLGVFKEQQARLVGLYATRSVGKDLVIEILWEDSCKAVSRRISPTSGLCGLLFTFMTKDACHASLFNF